MLNLVLMDTGAWIGILVGAIILTAVGVFFLTRWLFRRQLEKNPPITREMIRAMYLSMGRKPSEADINRTMNAMKNANK